VQHFPRSADYGEAGCYPFVIPLLLETKVQTCRACTKEGAYRDFCPKSRVFWTRQAIYI